MPNQVPNERIEAIRRFSRFYTRKIGVLHEGLLGSPLSLTEGRVLYELAHREPTTASEIAAELALDTGYLSRILAGFERRGLVERRPSESDGRQIVLLLAGQGRELFATMNGRSNDEIRAILDRLSSADQARLVAALETAETLLGGPRKATEAPYVLRPHRPGDIGWIIHRHGALYAEEYGFDVTFEALVARVAAAFIENYDIHRERCWIAERQGHIVGSVMLVKHTEEIAKLRLLYVEANARGLGIGRHLVNECIAFARLAGYRKIELWTNDVLVSARRIYQANGFQLVREELHHSFGRDLVGQYWELHLTLH